MQALLSDITLDIQQLGYLVNSLDIKPNDELREIVLHTISRVQGNLDKLSATVAGQGVSEVVAPVVNETDGSSDAEKSTEPESICLPEEKPEELPMSADAASEENAVASDALKQDVAATDASEEDLVAADALKQDTAATDASEEGLAASNVLEESAVATDASEEDLAASNVLEESVVAADTSKQEPIVTDVSKEGLAISDVLEDSAVAADTSKQEPIATDASREDSTATDVLEEDLAVADAPGEEAAEEVPEVVLSNERVEVNETKTLGDKVCRSASLKSMFSLNDIFRFTRELFGGEQQNLFDVLSELSQAASLQDAEALLRERVAQNANEDVMSELLERVERYFNNI